MRSTTVFTLITAIATIVNAAPLPDATKNKRASIQNVLSLEGVHKRGLLPTRSDLPVVVARSIDHAYEVHTFNEAEMIAVLSLSAAGVISATGFLVWYWRKNGVQTSRGIAALMKEDKELADQLSSLAEAGNRILRLKQAANGNIPNFITPEQIEAETIRISSEWEKAEAAARKRAAELYASGVRAQSTVRIEEPTKGTTNDAGKTLAGDAQAPIVIQEPDSDEVRTANIERWMEEDEDLQHAIDTEIEWINYAQAVGYQQVEQSHRDKLQKLIQDARTSAEANYEQIKAAKLQEIEIPDETSPIELPASDTKVPDVPSTDVTLPDEGKAGDSSLEKLENDVEKEMKDGTEAAEELARQLAEALKNRIPRLAATKPQA